LAGVIISYFTPKKTISREEALKKLEEERTVFRNVM